MKMSRGDWVVMLPLLQYMEHADTQGKKSKKFVRVGAGDMWEDSTLNDWPEGELSLPGACRFGVLGSQKSFTISGPGVTLMMIHDGEDGCSS